MSMEIPHYSQLVFKKAKKNPNLKILFYRDNSLAKWIGLTWRELADRVMQLASAYVRLGIKENDKIAICSQNRPQSFIVDFANFANRVVSVPMYATASASQIEYIVNDAQVSMIFVGDQQQYDNVLTFVEKAESLKKIVVFDESIDLRGNESAIYFSKIMELGGDEKDIKVVKSRQKAAKEDDLAILMYTSGTTGVSKGVMLTHSNLLEAMRIHSIKMTQVSRKERSLAFLPLSHIFERGWSYFCLLKDLKIYLVQNPKDIQQAVREVRPHYMSNVPRFWEKVAIGINEKIAAMSPFKRAMVTWAMAIGESYNIDYLRLDKCPPLKLKLCYKFADKFIFGLVKKTVGIENGKMFPTAGAYMDLKLIKFFRCMGIPITFGYGLTETFATVSCFDYKGYKFGTVGTVMPDVQVKIGEDDEILVKGKTITQGYYNLPEVNAESFVDGWFRTGDSGRIDEDGHLIIVDRIKDLFKTSNGKYIAPQQIETRLNMDRYIAQIVVIGDSRNFVTAIIVPELDALKEFAIEQNIAYENLDELLAHEKVQKLYTEHIEKAQEDMASFEKVKKFRLIKKGFSVESGEMTLTLKLRRAVIMHNYKELIDEMYESSPSTQMI